MMKLPRPKRLLFPTLTAVGALMLLPGAGCSRPAEPAQQGQASVSGQEPHRVSLVAVNVVHLPQYIEASGSLLADETVTLSAKVAGRVMEVFHDLGDTVLPGDELAAIDETDYTLAIVEKTNGVNQALARLGLSQMPEGQVDTAKLPSVQRAAAQYDNARTRLERLEQLHKQKLVSDQDFNDAQTASEIAKSEYDVAVLNAQAILAEARTKQAELATARQMLADAKVIAPRESESDASSQADRRYIVAQRLVAKGEYVSTGTPLFRLVDDNPIRLRMAISERHTSQIKVGQPVVVRVQAYDEPFAGQVSRISPEVNVANRTFLVEVSIPNPDSRLKPGGFAMGSIEISAARPTLLVPQEAVTTFAGVSKVFEVVDGKTRAVQVKLGDEQGQMVAVTQGLAAKQRIISPLPARMVAGQDVQVVEQPASAGTSDPAQAG